MPYAMQTVIRKPENTEWWSSLFPELAQSLTEFVISLQLVRLRERKAIDANNVVVRLIFENKEDHDKFKEALDSHPLHGLQKDYNSKHNIMSNQTGSEISLSSIQSQ